MLLLRLLLLRLLFPPLVPLLRRDLFLCRCFFLPRDRLERDVCDEEYEEAPSEELDPLLDLLSSESLPLLDPLLLDPLLDDDIVLFLYFLSSVFLFCSQKPSTSTLL